MSMDMIPIDLVPNILVGGIFFFFWIVAFIILYHLSRFGIGVQPKRLSAIFFLGSIILFFISITAYMRLDLSIISNLIP